MSGAVVSEAVVTVSCRERACSANCCEASVLRLLVERGRRIGGSSLLRPVAGLSP